MTWADLLKQFRIRAGLNKTRLADRLGVSISYITKLESGQRPPPEDQRDNIAESLGLGEEETHAFHVQAELERIDQTARKYLLQQHSEELFGGDTVHGPSSDDPDSTGHATAADALRASRSIPIINKVAAGYPLDSTDLDYPVGIADDYLFVPQISDPSAFAFYVQGDSMHPEFPPGTLLIASPNTAANNGDPCFVRFDAVAPISGCTFKRVFFDDKSQVRLTPINQQYSEQNYPLDHISGIWPVVYELRPVHGASRDTTGERQVQASDRREQRRHARSRSAAAG